jgi:hypothetical protein
MLAAVAAEIATFVIVVLVIPSVFAGLWFWLSGSWR